MASILSWEKNAANTVKRDVQGAVAQVNPLDGGRTFQTVQQHGAQYAPQPQASVRQQIAQPVNRALGAVDRRAVQSPLGRGLQTVGLGALQTGVEGLQGVAGLTDAANHKLGVYQGTSPITRDLTRLAKNIDATAKSEHSNKLLYHGTQVAGNVAGAFLGGAVPDAMKAIPGVGKVVQGAQAVDRAAQAGIAAKTANLAEHGVGGRVVANTIRNIAKPGVQAANAAYTGLQAGQQIANGRKVTPASVATNLAIGGVGFPAAGAAAHEVIAPVARKVVPAIGKGVQTLKDKHLIAPSNLSKDEVNSLAHFVDKHGSQMDPQTYAQGVAAANKAGIHPTDVQAMQKLVDAHAEYQGNRIKLAGKSLVNDQTGSAPLIEDGSTIPTIKKLVGKGEVALHPAPATPNEYNLTTTSTNKEISHALGSGELHKKDVVVTSSQADKPKQIHGTIVSSTGGKVTKTEGSMFASADNPTGEHYVTSGTTKIRDGNGTIHELNNSDITSVKSAGKPLSDMQQMMQDFKNSKTTPVGGKQSKQLSSEAVPAKVPGEQASGIASGNSTPVDVRQYIKDQVSAQEASRKAGQPSGLGRLKTPLADAKTKLVDSLAPIEDTLNQKITNENATGHITPQLDRALRADTIAGQYMKDNGLSHVIQNVPNTKEFDQYLIAKHAKDLEANGVKTGRNLAADDQLVQSLSPTYEPHAQAIAKYSQDLLDKTADYGLISKELAAHLKEKYPNYVPANRIFGEGELPKPPKGTGAGKASIGTQSVVQKIKGSDRAIESPLSSIINKTQQVIDQGERNKAAQILTGYKDLPGNPFNLRELAKDETVGTKPVISVLDNGVKRQFETTPEIAAAAKSLNKEQLGLIGKILAVPTRVLRLGATGLNPAFAGANIIKDLASGAINSKNPLRSSVANPRVFLKALVAATNHNSPEYGELVREGAGGTSFDIARDAPVQNVKSIRAQKNVGTKIAYTVTHPAQLFRVAENTIGRSEEFSRALQYYGGKEASLAKNASPEAARVMGAHAARNNTVNFARGGDYTKVLNSVLPYLNAGVQGSRTLIRNAGDRPAQTAAKLAVLGFFPTAAVTAWNLSDPKRKAAYDDIKEYEKQGNLVIVPPNPKKDAGGKWNVIKIPVSQEIANLNNIVRNGIETGAKDGSMKIGDLAGNLVGTVSSLNAQSPRQLIGQAMPQAIKPVVESVVNQNLFTGNKIVPDSQKNLDPRDQYGNTTSGTARVLGGLSNLSPRHIDNAIRTATGGLGQNVVNLADKGLAAAGAIKPGDVKGKSFYDSISGRFAGAQGSGQYDAIDKQSAALTKQLKATPGYQAMNPQDKAKALNRLTNQVTQTFTSKKALSSKQQDIKNGKADINSYLKPSTGGNTTADYNKSPDAEYKAAQARFDTNKSSMNDVQKIKAQNNLNKLKIGSQYDKSIRDLYSASKATAYQYVSTNKDGKAIADKLQAYDQALYDAGLVSYKKYSNGIAPAAKKGGSGRGRSTASRRSVPGVKVGSLKAPRLKTIKVSSSFKTPKLSSPKMKSARKSIPKFATKTPKLNVTKGNA